MVVLVAVAGVRRMVPRPRIGARLSASPAGGASRAGRAPAPASERVQDLVEGPVVRERVEMATSVGGPEIDSGPRG